MCNNFKPDCRYGNRNNNLCGNVHCPNEMSCGSLCVQKKTFQSQSLGRNNYQCPQCTPSSQMRSIVCGKHANSFLLLYDQKFCCFELRSTKRQFKMVLWMFTVLAGIVQDKSVSSSTLGKGMVKTVTIVYNKQRVATLLKFFARTKIRQLCRLAARGNFVLQTSRVVTTKMETISVFEKTFLRIKISYTHTFATKGTNLFI